MDKSFHQMLGTSSAMQQVFEQIRTIAPAQGSVLITGESGTGKEQVARALHAHSERAAAPFIVVNCAGIPAELLESEFFGHAAGAFTGARTARKGLLLEAHGGTLLLDEIGEMPAPLQAKLLRALQDGSIRPVGQDTEEQVDVRIFAATHRDLRSRVLAGHFREDLYYRLETFSIHIPPLRERGEDLLLLAHALLHSFAESQEKPTLQFSSAALALLRHYPFPGNVRELQNVIEHAVAFCKGGTIEPEHLPQRLHTPATTPAQPPTAQLEAQLLAGPVLPSVEELQRRYARLVLEQVGGNKRRAAAILGIGRRTLYRWLE